MGGNALKNTNTVRVDTETLNRVVRELVEYFDEKYPELLFKPVTSYSEKETHGDLDLLYCLKKEHEEKLKNVHGINFIDSFLRELKRRGLEFYNNGPVLSFPHSLDSGNFLQVDLIKVSSDEMNFADGYFSYNDLGNLMGRVFKNMGFKFSHKGLFYVFRHPDNPTYVFQELLVSQDFEKVLFLGDYSYDKFKEGFKNLEDIFEFTLSSKYSYKDIYLLENRNHVARVRDRKRVTYQKFLDYLEDNDGLLNKNSSNLSEDYYLKFAFSLFPDFKVKYDKSLVDLMVTDEFKSKFNGKVVSEVTGLTDKDLSLYMKLFRRSFSRDGEMKHLVNKFSQEDVKFFLSSTFNLEDAESSVFDFVSLLRKDY